MRFTPEEYASIQATNADIMRLLRMVCTFQATRCNSRPSFPDLLVMADAVGIDHGVADIVWARLTRRWAHGVAETARHFTPRSPTVQNYLYTHRLRNRSRRAQF